MDVQDWRETLEALGSLTGQNLSGYAVSFTEFINQSKTPSKAPDALWRNGKYYYRNTPRPRPSSSTVPLPQAQNPTVPQYLLAPKTTKLVLCEYDGCTQTCIGFAGLEAHLRAAHRLDNNATASRAGAECRHAACAPVRDALPRELRRRRGLLAHVLARHAGLRMRCRQCGYTCGVACRAQTVRGHLATTPGHVYVPGDVRLVYYDEV